MEVSWNETARPFQSISSPWTWIALPWANGSRTPRRCQTRRRTVAIKVNHCKLWVRSSGQQNNKWVEASTLNQTFANAVVACPIIEQPYEPGLRVFTSYDRASTRESNNRDFKVRCPSKDLNFWLFQFESWLCRWSFGVKIRGSKPEKLGFHLASCNMQLLANYTKYYTVTIFSNKSLIYIGFWRAWISVNSAETVLY